MAKVLIGYSACPLTRAAFEAQGHDVWTCDLLPGRGIAPKHFQCDIREVLGMSWDMAVLHPMCTVMAVSSAWALLDPNFEKYPEKGGYHQRLKPETLRGAERRAQQQIEFENFRQLLALPFPVAIENPAPSMISTAIRPPDQVIHPWMFGDDASKGTGLWLTKGLPVLTHSAENYCHPRMVGTAKRWANQTDAGQNKLSPGPARWLERSKTYPGIAAAMGAQWGKWLNGDRP